MARTMLAAARLLAAAGLAVDSYVHFDLAGIYSEAGGVISEGVLFRAEAVAALLVDLGPIGPLPDMYDPVWFGEKLLAAIGEGLVLLAAAAGIAVMPNRRAPMATSRDEASK